MPTTIAVPLPIFCFTFESYMAVSVFFSGLAPMPLSAAESVAGRALALLAAGAAALAAIHLVLRLAQLLFGVVEHLHLVQLLLEIRLHLGEGFGGVAGLSLLQTFRALPEFLGQFLKLLHLRHLRRELGKLLFELVGLLHLTGLAELLGCACCKSCWAAC